MLTLFGVLSIMVWLIVGVFDFQNYATVQNDLSASILDISEMTRELWNPTALGPFPQDEDEDSRLALLYENPVYMIVFNNAQKPMHFLTTQDTDEGTLNKIVEKAQFVEKTSRPDTNPAIGNLLVSSYVCYHPSNNMVMMIDVTAIRNELISHLFISILIGIGFEGLLYIACRKAAAWMIGPIEETFKKQRQFIADASHELKTPVAVILANAEAMEKDPNPKWLSNIEEEASRMNGLITDLLDLTRNEQQEIQMLPVNLSRLVEKQCLIQEAVMFEHHIELSETIEPDLTVNGQSSMLEQVIAILLDNAAAHSDGKIAVTLRRQGKDVLLSVSNTGVPIPPDQREKIFERFYRADESRNRSSGRYGLGLAIAKSIVNRHKGKIEVDCHGGWTTFTVVLHAAA